MVKRAALSLFFLLFLFTGTLAGKAQPAANLRGDQFNAPGLEGIRLLQSDAGGVVLELDTPSYQVATFDQPDGSYQQLNVLGAVLSAEPGKPQLPYFSTLIGLPAQGGFELHVTEDESQVLPGSFHLLPAPTPSRPPIDDVDNPDLSMVEPTRLIIPDTAAYASSQVLPEEAAWLGEESRLRDQRMVRLALYPFQYRASDGSLTWHKHLKVEVHFEIPARPATKAQESQASPFDAALQASLINYQDVKTWQTSVESQLQALQALGSSSVVHARYKLTVDTDGIYKISPGQLPGWDAANFNPANIHLACQGDDVAYLFVGDGDNQFESGEYLLFYGQRFRGDKLAGLYQHESDHWRTYVTKGTDKLFTPKFNSVMMEKYTKENAYWLTVEDTAGLRMAAIDQATGTNPVPTSFRTTVHAEQTGEPTYYSAHLIMEDTFFWKSFSSSGTQYSINLPLVISTGSARLRGEVFSYTYNDSCSPDHQTQFTLNGESTPFDDATWDGGDKYDFDQVVNQSRFSSGSNTISAKALVTPCRPLGDTMYMNWLEVDYDKLFVAENDGLLFSGAGAGAWNYQISGFSSATGVAFEIDNPLLPKAINGVQINGGVMSFQAAQGEQFAVYGDNFFLSPKSFKNESSIPDLKSPSNGADYIIISHPDFLATAQRLADYRADQGLRVKVIDINDLYDQFNYGIFHPIAIKEFLKYAYSNWHSPAPTYVVLVGDGDYYLNSRNPNPPAGYPPLYMPPFLAWVDPLWGEADSTNELASVSGDDIIPDMMIGRMPVNSAAELNNIIDKIIAYEQTSLGQNWQKNLVFVADHVPDVAGDFEAITERLISSIIPSYFTENRIYLNDYCASQSTTCTGATDDIIADLNNPGAAIISYDGHSADPTKNTYWAAEKAFQISDISRLSNGAHLPVVLSMTCWDGNWYRRPAVVDGVNTSASLTEELLRADNKGAVATFSPAGGGMSYGHEQLQNGFFKYINASPVKLLGEASIAAKMNVFAQGGYLDLIETYTIFGDPALRMNIQPFPQRLYLPVLVNK
jgi:hypothetical protein